MERAEESETAVPSQQVNIQTVPFYKLFRFADGFDIVLMSIGSICAVGHGVAWPLLSVVFGEIIDAFGESDRSHVVDVVSQASLKYLYLGIGSGVASCLQVSAWMITGERQATRIRGLYLQTILRQDITFFDTETTSGEVTGRLTGDTIILQDSLGEKVGEFIQLCATFFGGFAIALFKGWLLSLVVLSCIIPLAVVGGTMTKFMSKTSIEAGKSYSTAGNVVQQTVVGIKTVASFTGENLATESYNRLLRSAYTSVIKQAIASGLGLGALMFIMYSSYGLAVWYGSRLIIEKGYSGGKILTVIISISTGGVALGQVSPCLNAFSAGRAAAFKLFEAIERVPLIDSYDNSGVVPEDISGDIELKDVYFCYPARPEVQIFSGFSMHVPSGKTVALVGQSGSGKSTIISLVERFYDPLSGEVLLDGINLKKLQLKWLREKIGLVSQEPALFMTTIKENIAYGKQNATQEEIRMAAELANAVKFIDQLPKGLDTMVGEHGTQLSGGQKQRIAIARAILKNPKILLLDEATSALDAESEAMVQDALERGLSNRTTLVVAHRLSTIRNADIISVVEKGKIVEQGTHAELTEYPLGAYSQLIRLQNGPEQVETSPSFRSESGDSIVEVDTRISRIASHRTSFSRSTSQRLGSSARVASCEIKGEDCMEKVEKNEGKLIKVPLRRLASMNKPELSILLLGSFAAAVHGVLPSMFGIMLSNSVKIFFEPPNELRKEARAWSLSFVVLGGIGLLFIPVQQYFFGVAGGKLIQRVRSMCFQKVVHQELGWFDEPSNSSAAISARLSADASNLRGLVGDFVSLLVQNMSTITAGMVIAFVSNWRLAFIILALLPLLGLEAYVKERFQQGFRANTKVMYEEASQVANDAVFSIRTVASFCVEERVIRLYQSKCKGPIKHGVRLGVTSGLGFGFSNFILYGAVATIFYIGAHMVKNGKATFDELFRVFLSLTITAMTVSQSNAMASGSYKAKDSAVSIFKILDRKPEIDSSNDEGITLPSVRGSLNFNHVSFTYPSRPDAQILNNLCLSIPSGKSVALVGESGSGKSTIISLLERFYDPNAGYIALDGFDLRKLKLRWLRQQMGLVSQEPILFNETIHANIAYGRMGFASEEEITSAAKAANAHNFISGLPQGYYTSVGERGLQLSGGQKQRIAIARAILKDPRIVLLDEATSALDTESERMVQDALDRVMVNRTTVVVAHRLSTIKGADIITVMKNGTVFESGSHDALMRIADGAYASLISLHTSSPQP